MLRHFSPVDLAKDKKTRELFATECWSAWTKFRIVDWLTSGLFGVCGFLTADLCLSSDKKMGVSKGVAALMGGVTTGAGAINQVRKNPSGYLKATWKRNAGIFGLGVFGAVLLKKFSAK